MRRFELACLLSVVANILEASLRYVSPLPSTSRKSLVHRYVESMFQLIYGSLHRHSSILTNASPRTPLYNASQSVRKKDTQKYA